MNLPVVQSNLIVFAMVFIARMIIVPFDATDLSIGNYLWLPLGAVVMSYLLYGYKVFPGVFLAYILATVILKGSWDAISIYSYMGRLISSLAPLAAIMLMNAFHVSNFFDGAKINFKNIIFLIFLSSLLSTLAKFFVYPINPETITDPVLFIQSYLMGDIIGGIVFVYIVVKLLPQLVKTRL